jgi:hypothetical protein
MMNIEEMKCNVSHLLADRGLTTDYQEPSVRLLLYHLYVAMDIYRYMTFSEKNKAGFWYRTFKSSYRLTGFLKERKRKRDKEKSPLHPSYKERETEVKEKAQKTLSPAAGAKSNIESRQHAFWDACLKFEPEYDRQLLLKFYCYWAEEVNGTGLMLWETKTSWSMRLRLKAWSKKSYQLDDQTAALRLERTKAKSTQKEPSPLCTAEREDANERLFRQIEENKKAAVSREEWLRMKETQKHNE